MTDSRIVRRNQRTGSDIEVCTAESQGCDPDGGKWVTICWTHGAIVNHETKAAAIRWAATPDDWCEGDDDTCRAVWEAKEQAA